MNTHLWWWMNFLVISGRTPYQRVYTRGGRGGHLFSDPLLLLSFLFFCRCKGWFFPILLECLRNWKFPRNRNWKVQKSIRRFDLGPPKWQVETFTPCRSPTLVLFSFFTKSELAHFIHNWDFFVVNNFLLGDCGFFLPTFNSKEEWIDPLLAQAKNVKNQKYNSATYCQKNITYAKKLNRILSSFLHFNCWIYLKACS